MALIWKLVLNFQFLKLKKFPNQKRTLSEIFGDENTTVAPDMDELVDQFMTKFDNDIEYYLRDKVK